MSSGDYHNAADKAEISLILIDKASIRIFIHNRSLFESEAEMSMQTTGAAFLRGLIILVLAVLITACNQNRESSAGQPDKNTGNHKMYAQSEAIQTIDRTPAIDKLVPAELKTATFGLG